MIVLCDDLKRDYILRRFMGALSNTNRNNMTKVIKNSTHHYIDGLDIEIKKSKRKTICIQVKRDGSVCVLAPSRATNEAIEQFLLSKKGWLINATEKVRRRIKIKPSIADGTCVQFMGRLIKVSKLDQSSLESYRLEQNQLLLKQVDGSAFENALKHIFNIYINERILYFTTLLSVKPNKIVIKAQKSRWGSCNSKGELAFNWRLVFASEDVIDYVIVHELCHMIHMNHSKQFWETVKSVIPDYKIRRDWLKAEGGFIDWTFND